MVHSKYQSKIDFRALSVSSHLYLEESGWQKLLACLVFTFQRLFSCNVFKNNKARDSGGSDRDTWPIFHPLWTLYISCSVFGFSSFWARLGKLAFKGKKSWLHSSCQFHWLWIFPCWLFRISSFLTDWWNLVHSCIQWNHPHMKNNNIYFKILSAADMIGALMVHTWVFVVCLPSFYLIPTKDSPICHCSQDRPSMSIRLWSAL